MPIACERANVVQRELSCVSRLCSLLAASAPQSPANTECERVSAAGNQTAGNAPFHLSLGFAYRRACIRLR